MVNQKQMRYFFASYTAHNVTDNQNCIGNIWFPSKEFPPLKEIKEEIKNVNTQKNGVKTSHIVVTSIFEFKNEDDFNSFKS